MLRLGRSQRPDRRRQGEVGGLNRPLPASDVPPGGTLVCRSHPRGICPCKPTLAKGCMGTVHTTTAGYPRHPGCKASYFSCWTLHLLNWREGAQQLPVTHCGPQ